jgi:hypothetical protein
VYLPQSGPCSPHLVILVERTENKGLSEKAHESLPVALTVQSRARSGELLHTSNVKPHM